jgi:hypothetical protein
MELQGLDDCGNFSRLCEEVSREGGSNETEDVLTL